ncbi:MAG TPA: LCCL domain-containing protein [Roseomonas sp.]
MRPVLILLGLLALAIPGAARAQTACPLNFEGRGTPTTCICQGEPMLSGAVWGSGPYTSDSRVCRAALHAGAVTAAGGLVTITPAQGLQAYAGSAAHGVTTMDYGPWQASFTVMAGKPGAAAGVQACPANFEGQAEAMACGCDAAATMAGTVWGTGVYTTDSGVCRAAVHAGMIGAEGGPVTVVPAPGLPTYLGTTANGVTTADYGPWQQSFTFQR